jgi:competence protein ComEA
MLYSFLIKLGMWAATVAVVFWIGWTVPASFDRAQDAGTAALKVANAEGALESTVPHAVAPLSSRTQPIAETEKKQPSGKLDLNRASAEDFESLPGIGPVLAERIVEYRQSKGSFRTVADLRMVKGIGKKKFERVRTLVSVTPMPKLPGRGKQAT